MGTTQTHLFAGVQHMYNTAANRCVWFVLMMGFLPTPHAPTTQCFLSLAENRMTAAAEAPVTTERAYHGGWVLQRVDGIVCKGMGGSFRTWVIAFVPVGGGAVRGGWVGWSVDRWVGGAFRAWVSAFVLWEVALFFFFGCC